MSATMTAILVAIFVAVLLLYLKRRSGRLTNQYDDE